MVKRLALMGEDICFENIVNYLTDVEIVFIADNPNSDIFIRAKNAGVECRYIPKEELASYFAINNFDLIAMTNYADNVSEDVLTLGKFINIHPSLLPSFKGKDAMQMAYLSGVKVSGVTVHWVTSDLDGGKIITQYPVLIGNSTHFDEFKKEVLKLEKSLYPIVIDKILKDQVFDFQDLLGKCSSNCSGCSNC